jgi:hypothetical protein
MHQQDWPIIIIALSELWQLIAVWAAAHVTYPEFSNQRAIQSGALLLILFSLVP